MTNKPVPVGNLKVVDGGSSDKAWTIHKHAVRLRGEIEQRFVELARVLYIIRKHKVYQALGYETFEAYCAHPDLAIGRTQAYKMVSCHEQLVLRRGIDPDKLAAMSVTKASMILPIAKRNKTTAEEVDEWVAKAETLSTGDLAKEIRRTRERNLDEVTLLILERIQARIDRRARRLPDAHRPDTLLEQIIRLGKIGLLALGEGDVGLADLPVQD